LNLHPSFHSYDVKANKIESKLEFLLPGLEEIKDDFNIEEFLNTYHKILLDFCRSNYPEAPYPDPIIIPTNDLDFFIYFASFHIITCMVDEIDPFLDYHLSKYDDKQSDFIGFVEFLIINTIKNNSPRQSETDRIAIIRNWVKHHKIGYSQPTIKEVETIEKKEVKITVAPEIIDECVSKLKLYLDKNDLLLFSKLLSKEPIESKIIFLGTAGVFVDVFAQLKDKKLIVETKTTIILWICKNFEYQKNGVNILFNPDYVKRVLTSQSTPSKKSRIIIDFP